MNVTVISIEPSPGESDVQLDLAVLADQAIPVGVCNQVSARWGASDMAIAPLWCTDTFTLRWK